MSTAMAASWDTTVEWGLIWFGEVDFIPLPWLIIPIITPLYILIDTTGPKLYGLMLDGVSDAGRMFGER
jgi:hypothetical protein